MLPGSHRKGECILKTFHYKAYDEEGRIGEGSLQAASRAEAAERLVAEGLHPVRITEAAPGKRRRKKLTRRELAVFAGEWAALLTAGLTLTESLHLLEQQAGRRQRAALAELSKTISSGRGVWESLEQSGLFPPFFISLVKVGELTGTLPAELTRLAAFYKKEEEMAEKLKRALAYPAFVIVFALVVLFIILTVVLPSFSFLFSALSINLPPMSQKALSFGLFLRREGSVLAAGLLVFLLAACLFLKSRGGHRWLLRRLYRWKWYRRILLIQFCYTLAAFLESGKTLTASLGEVKAVLAHPDTDRAISRMAVAVTRGGSFTEAMEKSGFSSPLAAGLIRVGLESGELPRFLSQAADLLTEETERTFQRFRALLEPCLLLFVGGLTAFILFSVMLPVFNAAGSAFMK